MQNNENKIFIGIDPGTLGAISFIDKNRKVLLSQELVYNKILSVTHLLECFHQIIYTNYNKTLADYKVGDIIPLITTIEKPIAMPRQDVNKIASSFLNYGQIIGFLNLFQIPYTEVHPRKWKGEYSLIKKNKKESVKMAEYLFPSINFYTKNNRMMDGKAESLLLADYALRKYKLF